jgi:hypothetical protein
MKQFIKTKIREFLNEQKLNENIAQNRCYLLGGLSVGNLKTIK